MLTLTEKKCGSCKKLKKFEEFTKDRKKPFGLCFECKECRSLRRKTEHYREKQLKQNRDWHRRNKDRRREIDFTMNLMKKFKLTPEQYWQMFKDQGEGCAICSAQTSKSGKRLAVDHCHQTDKIRGLLCNECNTGIGLFEDQIQRLEAAISYLRLRSKG